MKSSLLLAASMGTTLFISACQNVAVETNVSPSNFEEYFKPSSVEVYDKNSILEHRYHSLGMVVGLACQEKPEDFIARDTEARLDALIQTADLGGNGIVYNKCIRLERTKACHVSVTCYAEAFVVDNGKPNLNAKNLNNADVSAQNAAEPAMAQGQTQAQSQAQSQGQAQAQSFDQSQDKGVLVAPVVSSALVDANESKAASMAPSNQVIRVEPKPASTQDEIPTFKIEDADVENMSNNSNVDQGAENRVESKQKLRRNRMYKIQLD